MDQRTPEFQQQVPLYVRVANDIIEIAKGMSPHSLLPSEPELVKKYGVSRGTIKQALGQLENQGLVYRRQGKGTFVAEPKILRHSHTVPSFSEDIRRRGLVPSIKVVALTKETPNKRVSLALSIEPSTLLWKAKRVFLADGKPLALVTSYLPTSDIETLTAVDIEAGLYRSLERRYGRRPTWASDSYTAVLAEDEIVKYLAVKAGDPIIYSERVAYLSDMHPIEYVESYVSGDRFTVLIDWMPAESDSESVWSKLNRDDYPWKSDI